MKEIVCLSVKTMKPQNVRLQVEAVVHKPSYLLVAQQGNVFLIFFTQSSHTSYFVLFEFNIRCLMAFLAKHKD